MNEFESLPEPEGTKSKSIGQLMIEAEEKNTDVRDINLELLKVMQVMLLKTPPILTLNLELANLRMNDHANFIYNDLDDFFGKLKNNVHYL